MITFKQFCINESTNMELVGLSYESARTHIENILGDKFNEIKNFKHNYLHAQKLAALGWTKRKDMPRITSSDINDLKNRLQQGFIDITAPYSPETRKSNLFPEKLSGEAAKTWLQNGLAINDGSSTDDKVKAEFRHVEVGSLKPIQKQIYFNKSVEILSKGTLSSTKSFIQSQTIYVVSSDNYIIDGHHRFLAGVIMDPKMKVQVISIDLPISKLLPLAIAYGDSIGNGRNK